MTWLVVGASAGLGRALAERLARDGRALLLVASDGRDLDPLVADLRLRFSADVRGLAADVATATAAEEIDHALGGQTIEGLLFPVGAVDERDNGQLSGVDVDRLVRVNLTSVMSITSRLLSRMLDQGQGVIVGFGSIAAARGRGRNVAYSAAKRALESYFESLRHVCEARGIVVTLYVVGFMDTHQTFGRRFLLSPAQPARLAERVCRELGRRRGQHYLPRWWRFATAVLRALPWSVFRRMQF
jgi:short-subunit dehydrogenase